jgi:CRP-like cAMP-binding protein
VPENNVKQVEDILAQLPIFRQVAPAHLHRLARQAQLQRAAKDTLLYRRGDAAAGCYALVRGLLKLSICAPDGAEKVLRLVQAGETFAESVMFDPQPQPVNALALADSEVVFLPLQALNDLLDHDRNFARTLLASLSRRIHLLIADIEAYSLSSGSQRLAAYLNALAAPSDPAPARVRLPANKTVIASRLGITKETLSRLLHDLTVQGLVAVSRREIVLHDPRRLAELARGTSTG